MAFSLRTFLAGLAAPMPRDEGAATRTAARAESSTRGTAPMAAPIPLHYPLARDDEQIFQEVGP